MMAKSWGYDHEDMKTTLIYPLLYNTLIQKHSYITLLYKNTLI
jgi:hypothetical protein